MILAYKVGSGVRGLRFPGVAIVGVDLHEFDEDEAFFELLKRCDCVLLGAGWELRPFEIDLVRFANEHRIPVFDQAQKAVEYFKQRRRAETVTFPISKSLAMFKETT